MRSFMMFGIFWVFVYVGSVLNKIAHILEVIAGGI